MFQGFRQLQSIIRLTPFDTSSPEGASKERYRRIALTTATSVLAKCVGFATMLVSLPLTVTYLGDERFGLWMTITSLIAYLGFADLGMGNGLLNAIARAYGQNDLKSAQKSISSGFFILMAVACSILAVFASIYGFIPWARLFNVTSHLAAQESGPALAVLVCCFVISMPVGIVQRVQLGYQEGFASNLWQIAGSLLGLMGVLLAIRCKAGLPWLVLGVAGMPALVTLANWLHYFNKVRPELFPKVKLFDWPTSRHIMNTGLTFMILQVLALNWFSTDNLVIAQELGAPAVAGYAIVQRLFSIGLVAQFFISPLWPAYGEAIARNDYAWARKTLNRAFLLGIGLTLALSVPLLIFGKMLVAHWMNAAFTPPLSLLMGCTALNVLMIIAGNLSGLLVHGDMLKKQVLFYAAASLTALTLKVLLAVPFGISGVVWASVSGFGVLYTPFALRLAYQSLKVK